VPSDLIGVTSAAKTPRHTPHRFAADPSSLNLFMGLLSEPLMLRERILNNDIAHNIMNRGLEARALGRIP
jgi:hypothetical protein